MASLDDLENDDSGERRLMEPIEPSPQIKALDDELKLRFQKRTDSLDRFLNEWMKLDSSQDMMFGAIGIEGENFFQHVLARDDTNLALALAKICEYFAQTQILERVNKFMNHADKRGNDLWHYLANCLSSSESEDGLQIAKILINLEISFTRKNDDDETALSKLLLPEPKWRSINSVNTAKELMIDDLEESFSEAIHNNQQLRQEVMVNVFASDMIDNDALLTTTIMRQALSSRSERDDRAKAVKLFFEDIGGPRRETIFMRAVEPDQPKLFDQFIDLMTRTVEDETREIAARDGQIAFAQQQVLLYKRLSVKNRSFQNIVTKAIVSDKPKYLSTLCSMLKNEEMILTRKDEAGRTIKEDVVADEKSPAPRNPGLSLLLQQDARGNTPYHTAAFLSRTDCLKRLFNNLSLMDSYMIASRIPNRYGVTVQDTMDPKIVAQKLTGQLKSGKINQNDAQQLLTLSKRQTRELKEFLGEMVQRASDTIERTGGLSEAKPTFDLKRVPTVMLMLREMKKKQA